MLGHAHFSRHILRLPSRFQLLQSPNHLRLAVPAPRHVPPLSAVRNHTQFCADLGEQVTAPGGTTETTTVNYSSFNVRTNFGCSGITEGGGTGIYMPVSVAYPNGQSYSFSYEATPGYSGYVTGRIEPVTLPTGGYYEYDYPGANDSISCAAAEASIPQDIITQLTRNVSDGSKTLTYAYGVNYPTTPAQTTMSVSANPVDSSIAQTIVTTFSSGNLETSRQVYQGSTLLRTVNTTWSENSTYLVPSAKVTILEDGKTQSETDTTWLYAGIPLQVTEYGFGVGGKGSLIRTTNYTYGLTGSSYTAANILNRVTGLTITDNISGNVISQTNTSYDTNAFTACITGAPGHNDTAFPCTNTTRGNATTITKYANAAALTGPITYQQYYDSLGNLRQSANDSCTQTTWNYSATTEYGYPDSTVCGTSPSLTTSYTYDFGTGLPLSMTDPNSQVTTYSYDYMKRPLSVSFPDGGSTADSYNDSAFTVTETTAIGGGVSPKVTETFYDALGRPKETELVSDPSGPDFTLKTYDALSRLKTVTNPYRTISDLTYGTTTYSYDVLNRKTLVTEQDNSTVAGSYSLNSTTVTDEAGKTRESIVDGLGRITEMVENPGGLGYVTNYTYDALDDLLTVTQGGSRTRTFTYDSLKRLASSNNPESGVVSYTYTTNSNVLTKTDARQIKITYAWDDLNHLLSRTYSNSDPTVSYSYGSTTCVVVSTCYNIGRMTGVTDAAGSESFAYDKMGRLWGDQRTTNSITKNTAYTYNLDGSLAALTNPSGRAITYTYNSAAKPLLATDGSTEVNYVSSVRYAPNGAPIALTLGSTVNYTLIYNQRWQPCWTWASPGTGLPVTDACTTTATTGTIFDLKYNYNSGADNGNLAGITNDRNSNRSQTYGYDALNRITSAGTVATCTASCWGLTFGLDEWANLKSATASGTATPLSLAVGTNNQITTAPFTFDAAGNELTDATYTYTWNAESQIKTAGDASYLYDGLGHRVEKSGTKLYWYGGSGQVLDETDATGSTSNATFNEHFYFNGARVGRRDYLNNAYYYFADQVNNSRVIAEVPAGTTTATLCYDADFYPYGGEIDFTSTCTPTHKFQGEERDPETGNDYHAARFYSYAYGRFLSPDPAGIFVAGLTNPQRWNLYGFVTNNPLSFIDPTGLDTCYVTTDGTPGGTPDGTITTEAGCRAKGGTWIPTLNQTITVNGNSGVSVYASDDWVPTNDSQLEQTQKQNIFTCAAGIGDKYSIAGGLHALGIGTSGVAGFVTDALGGNSFSGATNLVASLGSGTAGGHNVFYNMGQGVVAGPGQGILPPGINGPWGASASGLATDAIAKTAWSSVTGAGQTLTTLGGEVSLASTAVTAVEFASGVAEAKYAYDLLTYAIGLSVCAAR